MSRKTFYLIAGLVVALITIPRVVNHVTGRATLPEPVMKLIDVVRTAMKPVPPDSTDQGR